MIFAEPHLLWLALAAPATAAAAAWAARGLWERLLAPYSRRRLAASVALLALAVLGTSLALARPRWGQGEHEVERRGVDVVFVLDSSLSMGAADVRPSRLYAAKTLIRRLVHDMPQNRVALIQSEGSGVVLAPLTFDGGIIDLLLDTVAPGSLPTPGTELAPALDQAVKLFPEGEKKHRVIVLVSDGEDHGGGLGSRVQKLADEGVVVNALGVGTVEGDPVPIPGGGEHEYKRYQGKVVISHLDEAVLESLARGTGGVYLRVGSPAADLGPVTRRIDQMETRKLESQSVDSLEERFQWPLAAGATCLLLFLGLGAFRNPTEVAP